MHIVAVKVVLSKLLCLFVFNVILEILSMLLNRLHTIVNNFIWSNKKPRIWLARLGKLLLNGGLATNLTKYYHAALLVSCTDWCNLSEEEIKGLLTQEGSNFWLTDWLTQDKPSKLTFRAEFGYVIKKYWFLLPRLCKNFWIILY